MDHSVSGSTFIIVTFAALIFGIFVGIIMGKSASAKAGIDGAKGANDLTGKNKVKLPAQAYDVSSYPEAPPEVLALLPYNKIEAIKKYREMTGLGLKQSKDVIDAIGQNRKLGGRAYAAADYPEVPPEVLAFLPNKKIEAIKKYREMTGLGLKESKDVIDAVYKKMRT